MNSYDSFSVAGSELRPYLKVSTSRWHIVFCVCWEAVLIILALSVSLGLFGLGFLILIYIITEKWMNLYILRDRANQKRYPAVEPLPTVWSKHIICTWNLLILFTCISFSQSNTPRTAFPSRCFNQCFKRQWNRSKYWVWAWPLWQVTWSTAMAEDKYIIQAQGGPGLAPWWSIRASCVFSCLCPCKCACAGWW